MGRRMRIPAILLMILMLAVPAGYADDNEVTRTTPARVVVRQHPKTGRPYVVIASDKGNRNPLVVPASASRFRPDYRMLDPKMKSGKIPYEGPVSDRKKVYIFAATVAALGTAGGASIIAAAPAATGTGAAGGAGAYAAAGAGVATGTVSAALDKTRPDPDKDKIEQGSVSRQVAGRNI